MMIIALARRRLRSAQNKNSTKRFKNISQDLLFEILKKVDDNRMVLERL